MAQSGFTPIQLYRSTTSSAAPSPGNLADGELAINTNDGKLFYKDSGGNVQTIATKAGANGDVVGPASATDNGLVAFDGTTGKLVKAAGTVTIAQGGTNATTASAALSNLGGLPLVGGTLTGPTIVSVNSSSDALRITQTGAGNALVVEDSTNPDSTPFVINADGEVGIGTSTPSSALEVVGDITAPDQNSYLAASLTKPDIRPSLDLDFANVKALDPRITFTRASEGRYYDGKTTAKAEENLLLNSQDYSATWAVTNLTPVTGKTAPDTTSTATEFTAGAANATLTQSVTALAADYTFSVWLRRVTGTGDIDITAHSGGTWVTQAISGTWARYTVTQTLTVGARTPGIRVVTSGDVIEVWGAQLEQRSAATAYTATTTQPITNYVPQLLTAASGVARFDHDPITCESLGLLIEEQRTNLLTYSEDFASAAWVKTNTSIESDVVIAPDGSLTSDKIIESAVNSTHELRRNTNAAVSSLTTYTQSIYVKAAERNLGALQMIGNSGDSVINFDLVNGTVAVGGVSGGWSNASATIKPVGNGWFLVSHTATTNSGITGLNWRLFIKDALGNTSYTGDGYSGIYIWGAQLEAGAFPTSYIPTTASQVTRSADAASMTGTNFSSWYRQDEGTIYAEAGTNQTSFTITNDRAHVITLASADSNNSLEPFLYGTGLSLLSRNNGTFSSAVTVVTGSVGGGISNKLVVAYTSDGNAQAALDGVLSASLVRPFQKPQISQMVIGNSVSVPNRILDGHLKKLAYYPKRLTNAQLQALTK